MAFIGVVSVLAQFPSQSLKPDQINIIWDSKQGFTIRTPTLNYTGLFFCQSITDGVTYRSQHFFVHRPGQYSLSHITHGSRMFTPMYVHLSDLCIVSCYAPVSNIMEVSLNSSGPVQALKGERLVLNCTATAELNTRVNITWDYPQKVRCAFKFEKIEKNH